MSLYKNVFLGLHWDRDVLWEQQCDRHVPSDDIHQAAEGTVLLKEMGGAATARVAQDPVLGTK